jgi:hypothetical protein
MAKDIMLTPDNDLQILNGDFVIGESLMQEVGIILQMNQGELKSDPLIGANLIVKMRGVENKYKIESLIDAQLELDGKDYDTIKEFLKINI